MIEKKLEPVRLSMPEQEVRAHLSRYEHLALESGATRAGRIPAAAVPVDDRVSLKCSVPKCFGYGTCANCPPHSLKPEETRRIAAQYGWAVGAATLHLFGSLLMTGLGILTIQHLNK